MNRVIGLLFGRDPVTGILGYLSGGLTAWVTSRVPGLTKESSVQDAISVIVFLLYALWGRQTNEKETPQFPVTLPVIEPAKGGE